MAEEATIDTQPTPPPAPLATLDTEAMPKSVSPAIASVRASHAQYGLNKIIPDMKFEDYFQPIANGREVALRQQVAARMNADINDKTAKAMVQMAAERPGQMTLQDYDTIRKSFTPVKPTYVFEQAFGREYLNSLYKRHDIESRGGDDKEYVPFHWLKSVTEFNDRLMPGYAQILEGYTEKANPYVALQELIHHKHQEAQEKIDKESWMGWGINAAKPLVPFFSDIKLRGALPGSGSMTGVLTGENLKAQRDQLLTAPSIEEAEKLINQATANMDPHMAQTWLEAMLGQSITGRTLNNVLPLIDLSVGYGAVKGVVKGTSFALRQSRYTREAVRQSVERTQGLLGRDVGEVAADATGDISEAATLAASRQAYQEYLGRTNAKTAWENLVSILNPFRNEILENPGAFGRQKTADFFTRQDRNNLDFINTFTNIAKLERIPVPVAIEGVVRKYMAEDALKYGGLTNHIVGTSETFFRDPVTGKRGYFYYFGDSKGDLFTSEKQLQGWTEINGLPDAFLVDTRLKEPIVYREGLSQPVVMKDGVVQKGLGFAYAKWHPVDETHDILRDALIKTGVTESKYTWLNSHLSWLRTPEETMSPMERANRGLAEYAPQALLKASMASMKEIRQFVKRSVNKWKDWERFIKATQSNWKDVQGEVRWPTLSEMDDWYTRVVKRPVEEAEYKAYLAHVDAIDKDYIIRNLRYHANAARVGAASFRFWHAPEKGQETEFAPWFNGRRLTGLPSGGSDIALVFDGKGGVTEHRLGSLQWLKAKKVLEEDFKATGLNSVEIYDPDLKEFSKFSDHRVRYIIHPNIEERNLPYFNIPRQAGGHFIYDYDHWIKQAKVHKENIGGALRHVYTGDTTLMPITIRRMGKDIVEKLEKVRKLIAEDKIDEARLLHDQLRLPMSWDEHHGWYKERTVNGAFRPARLDKNEPLQLLPRGLRIVDQDHSLKLRYTKGDEKTNGEFVDGTRSGSLARQSAVEFTGERDAHDLMTIVDEGSKGNPLYKYQPAELLDPVPALNKGMSRIISSFFMDDYKYYALEHWLAEAKDFLKADPQTVRYSPFHHFMEAGADDAWKPVANHEGEAAQKIRQLKQNYLKIKQFMGTPSAFDSKIYEATQQLVDSVYGRYGPTLAPTWALPFSRDPSQFIRSVVFHMKLGLFNVPQFFKQAMTFVNVIGMAGMSKAGPGTAATLFHDWIRLTGNEAMVEHLDKYLSKFHVPGMEKWKAGWFKESYEAVKKTGFLDGVHSHVFYDGGLSLDLAPTIWNKWFLKPGTAFFSEGANWTKMTSWHTAFLEHRLANPVGKITEDNIRDILLKARTYNHNMDRASSARLQSGFGAFPLQFRSYSYRLAELMTGSRLTPQQKLRFIATTSSLYGLPIGAGVYGLPFDDFFRPYMQSQGYTPGQNFINTTFMEGLPSAILGSLTGKHYDIGKQWGPEGFAEFTKPLRGDYSMIQRLVIDGTGASGATVADALSLSDPFWFWLYHGMIKGDAPGFELKADHYLNAAKSISSISRGVAYITALTTGQLFSRNNNLLQNNTSATEASLMALFGLLPQDVINANAMEEGLKHRAEMEKQAEKRFKKEFEYALKAGRANNPDEFASRSRNAMAFLKGFVPPDKWAKIIAEASEDWKPIIDKIDKKFYLDNIKMYPPDQQKALRDAFTYRQGLK